MTARELLALPRPQRTAYLEKVAEEIAQDYAPGGPLADLWLAEDILVAPDPEPTTMALIVVS